MVDVLEQACMQIIPPHSSGDGGTGARTMQCQGVVKDMFLEAKHETCTGVAQYDVYLDILLMVPCI